LAASINRHLKISIAGREPKGKQHKKQQGLFVGTYTTEDLAAKQRLHCLSATAM